MRNTNTPGSDPRLLINIFGAREMPDWIKPAEAHEIIDGKVYFIAQRPLSRVGAWSFYSESKNGKLSFTRKPGIAIQYIGSEDLRNAISGKDGICCVEVPSNADKRWRARR